MSNKAVKDFFTSEEYKTKRVCLITGIFMVILGCYFVIPYFGMLGVFWTVFSALYTILIFIRIVIKANDVDTVSYEIQKRDDSYGEIEGEKDDIRTDFEGKVQMDVDDYNHYKLLKLTDDYNNGRITEQEFQAERDRLMQNDR